MAINLEYELKEISVRLKALSKRVDKMASGIVKPKKTKQKIVINKGASKAEVSIDKNDREMGNDISTVSVHGIDDVDSEVSPNLQM
jgi:hypothetical protein